MSRFEDALRSALRHGKEPSATWPRACRPDQSTATRVPDAVCDSRRCRGAGAVGGGYRYRQYRDVHAEQQLWSALEITSYKLALARTRLKTESEDYS